MKGTLQRLGKEIEIQARKKYPIPPTTSHVGAKTGNLVFFKQHGEGDWSSSHTSRNHWRFWQIPPGGNLVWFPDFSRTSQGWNYGKPKFE